MRIGFPALFLASCLLLAACVENLPLPEGRAEILGSAELCEEGEFGRLIVDYSITNEGSLPIERSVLSFRYRTERRRYHFTAVEELRISPGGQIFGSAFLEYLELGERGEPESLELASAFYE